MNTTNIFDTITIELSNGTTNTITSNSLDNPYVTYVTENADTDVFDVNAAAVELNAAIDAVHKNGIIDVFSNIYVDDADLIGIAMTNSGKMMPLYKGMLKPLTLFVTDDGQAKLGCPVFDCFGILSNSAHHAVEEYNSAVTSKAVPAQRFDPRKDEVAVYNDAIAVYTLC